MRTRGSYWWRLWVYRLEPHLHGPQWRVTAQVAQDQVCRLTRKLDEIETAYDNLKMEVVARGL